MTRLSVNINKIATIRNARGGNMPDVTKAALDCERFGAEGITVHPRPDERHIRYSDVRIIRPLVTTEFNIEGNPIPSFVDLVNEVVPDQVTLVPDAHDAITSNAGWDTLAHKEFLTDICKEFKAKGIRILTAQLQDSELYYDTPMTGGTAIVVGSEALGLTQVWRDAADAHIRIPMLGKMDSLNASVSAAILLFEAVRQRTSKKNN